MNTSKLMAIAIMLAIIFLCVIIVNPASAGSATNKDGNVTITVGEGLDMVPPEVFQAIKDLAGDRQVKVWILVQEEEPAPASYEEIAITKEMIAHTEETMALNGKVLEKLGELIELMETGPGLK